MSGEESIWAMRVFYGSNYVDVAFASRGDAVDALEEYENARRSHSNEPIRISGFCCAVDRRPTEVVFMPDEVDMATIAEY